MASPAIVGIVLAAGDGARMGGSKALLLVEGEPLAAVHARHLREAGCERVIVVVRPEVAEKLGTLEGTRVVGSTAGDPAGSLAVAVREGRVGVGNQSVVVITLVDAAPVGRETVGRLLGALGIGIGHGHGQGQGQGGTVRAATAGVGGKGGHPVACWGEVLDVYRAGEAPTLRDVLRGLGDARVRVETSDPRVLIDLDTPEDFVAWAGHRPVFVGDG